MRIVLRSLLNRRPTCYDPRSTIAAWLREDEAFRDWTSRWTVPSRRTVEARIVAKEGFVLAGLEVAREVFRTVDRAVRFRTRFRDGDDVRPGTEVCVVEGRAAAVLGAERLALNLLQRMSGVATEARRLCRLVEGTRVRLLDTRKTAPGLRYLDKYAASVGGMLNHRLNLADGILVKENHIAAAGGLRRAVEAVVRRRPSHLLVEVEVRTPEELEEALGLPVDIVMLDHFDVEAARRAVERAGGRRPLEVSGNVGEANLRSYAETGVDYISVGAVTHSVRSVDLSLLVG